MFESPHEENFLELEINEKRKRRVTEVFKEFGLAFEIEKYPDLIQRLVDTGDHFEDAREMTKMIDAIKDRLEMTPAEREKLLTATLLHDIGKSGPAHCLAGSPERQAIKKLFSRGYIEVLPPNFSEFAKILGFDEPEELALKLSTDNIKVETGGKVITFFRLHVDWTYEILKAAGVDEEIVKIAAAHHILENKNPANLSEDEIGVSAKILETTDKYHAFQFRVLAIADQYQAVRDRSAKPKTHADIIAYLRGKVSSSALSESLKAEYKKIIDEVFDLAEVDLNVRARK